MIKLVTLTLTDNDCLSLRLALNATAMEWGDKASAARHAGNDLDARTCESIRSDYHRLWEAVNVAQEAAPATCCQFHASGGDTVSSCGGDTAYEGRHVRQWRRFDGEPIKPEDTQ